MKIKKDKLVALAIAGLLSGIAAPKAFAGDAAATHAEANKDACSGKDGCNGKDSCNGKSAEAAGTPAAGEKNNCNGKDKANCKAKEGCNGSGHAAPATK